MPLLCCDVGMVSELRLTAGCVLMDLASPAVSGTSVYANGLKTLRTSHTTLHHIPDGMNPQKMSTLKVETLT
jgi:hypothetical protein